MSNYHPNDNTFIEYSAGTLSPAVAICVSAHLAHCPECRFKLDSLNALGGTYLESAQREEVKPESFDELMAKINDSDVNDININSQHSATEAPVLPAHPTINRPEPVITKLLESNEPLNWKRVSPSLSEAVLSVGQNTHEVCFHKIRKGGRVAEHNHGGSEITVVLEGSFSDENGNYTVGDYIEREPGDIHRPMAAQNEDCLCLTVVEAPVQLTGIVGKFVNPFLSFRPR